MNNQWIKFLHENVSPKEYKLWDMDTRFYQVFSLFKEKTTYVKIKETLEVKFLGNNKKGNGLYHLYMDGKLVTPTDRKSKLENGVSWGAMRQYLQLLDLARIIICEPKEQKTNWKIEIVNPLVLEETVEELMMNIGKRILRQGYKSEMATMRNAWLSLVLCMIDDMEPMMIHEIDKIGYGKKVKRGGEDKVSQTLMSSLREIKYTYQDFYKNGLLDYFKTYGASLVINEYDEKYVIEIDPRDKMTRYILDEVSRRRNDISDVLRQIRNYSNDSDLTDIKVPLNALDAAHIKSVSQIKQEALIEASRLNPNKKVIDTLLDQINNQNNVILIPHNYHYLLDKGYLTIDENGFFKKTTMSSIYDVFGIVENARLKVSIWNAAHIEFLKEL